MSSTKEEIKALLDELPDDCSSENIQYHLPSSAGQSPKQQKSPQMADLRPKS